MNKLIKSRIVVALLLAVGTGYSWAAPKWVVGDANTCPQACAKEKLFAASSGSWGQNPYFICAANHGNGGYRPGFNVSTTPEWSHSCTFEWNKGRGQSKKFHCLCTDDQDAPAPLK